MRIHHSKRFYKLIYCCVHTSAECVFGMRISLNVNQTTRDSLNLKMNWICAPIAPCKGGYHDIPAFLEKITQISTDTSC